ncbi:MAG: hypothetical protein ACRDWA_10805 [Acidimicrobiia bacterium]
MDTTWFADPRVITSAVITALLTTLAVEYLAKPWLKARKQRILDEHRLRRDLQRELNELAASRGVIDGIDRIWDLAPTKAQEEVLRFRTVVTRIRDLLPVLHNWRVPSDVTSWLSIRIGQLDGSLLVLLSCFETEITRDQRDAAIGSVADAHEALIPAADYIILRGHAHRQPWISRKRTMRAARRAIKNGDPLEYPPLRTNETSQGSGPK